MTRDQVLYICEGTCKAEISEEEFNNGLTQCGTEGCTLKGHQFRKMIKCGTCGKVYSPETPHSH